MTTQQFKQTPLDLLGKIVLGSDGNKEFLEHLTNSFNSRDAVAFFKAKQYAGYGSVILDDRIVIISGDGNSIYQFKFSKKEWEYKNQYFQHRKYGYNVTSIKGKHYYIHRLVWTAHKGSIPAGITIDHIDGNHFNNNISNLQLLTQSENSRKGMNDTLRKYDVKSLASFKGV